MKKFVAALLLTLALSSAACRNSTSYGECQGLLTEDQESPKLVYRPSTLNTVLGIIFFETVFAPVIAFGFDLYCPVGTK